MYYLHLGVYNMADADKLLYMRVGNFRNGGCTLSLQVNPRIYSCSACEKRKKEIKHKTTAIPLAQRRNLNGSPETRHSRKNKKPGRIFPISRNPKTVYRRF